MEFLGPIGVAIIVAVLYFLSSIKILAEYERGVIFNLGRLRHQAKGPGIILVLAPVQRMVRVSLRQEALELSEHSDTRGTAGKPVILRLQFNQLDRLAVRLQGVLHQA